MLKLNVRGFLKAEVICYEADAAGRCFHPIFEMTNGTIAVRWHNKKSAPQFITR